MTNTEHKPGIFRRAVVTLSLRHKARKQRDRQSGVALLITISSLAFLIALVSEFSYGTHIQAAQAANARDELRAHYNARAAISLSRLLIKIQLRFVDPIMASAQKMLSGMTNGSFMVSLRVTDYAGPILGFFGGRKEEVNALGSLIGLDTENAKGLGMESGYMDADIMAEDGKIDLNCGAGISPNREQQLRVFRMVSSLMFSPRYQNLFQRANADGQFPDRLEISRALIDWADADELGFSIDANAGGSEDYRYDARKDPYRAHNNHYDSIAETSLIRGMDANFVEAFQPYFTTYASDPLQRCRINLATVKGDCTPLLVGVIRAAVLKDPNTPPADPSILDDNRVYPLARVLCERGTAMGFDSLDTIVSVMSNPAGAIAQQDPRYAMMQGFQGVRLTRADLEQVAYVGPPRVYRVIATGEAGKVKKKITAIIDTARTPSFPLTKNPVSEKAAGVLQYWREE